jgi:hypothetical protein
MADPKLPYVKWRDGRPRSPHGAYARALGFVDGDLRHPPHDEDGRPVGRWFNLQEASDFSDKRKLEIEAARRAGKLPKKITVRKRSTIEDLLDDWSKSEEFKGAIGRLSILLSQVHLRHPVPTADARGRSEDARRNPRRQAARPGRASGSAKQTV